MTPENTFLADADQSIALSSSKDAVEERSTEQMLVEKLIIV